MNERIRELAEQVGITENNLSDEDMSHHLKKFAELIIRECIAMADDFECDVNQRGLVDRMKQHFDIKEDKKND